MLIKEIQKKDIKVLTDITCDICGLSCLNPATNNFEYMALKASWGFGTNKDMEKWTAQICEKCVDEKFSEIKFKKEEYDLIPMHSTQEEFEELTKNNVLSKS